LLRFSTPYNDELLWTQSHKVQGLSLIIGELDFVSLVGMAMHNCTLHTNAKAFVRHVYGQFNDITQIRHDPSAISASLKV